MAVLIDYEKIGNVIQLPIGGAYKEVGLETFWYRLKLTLAVLNNNKLINVEPEMFISIMRSYFQQNDIYDLLGTKAVALSIREYQKNEGMAMDKRLHVSGIYTLQPAVAWYLTVCDETDR